MNAHALYVAALLIVAVVFAEKGCLNRLADTLEDAPATSRDYR